MDSGNHNIISTLRARIERFRESGENVSDEGTRFVSLFLHDIQRNFLRTSRVIRSSIEPSTRRRYRYTDEEAESADELINPVEEEEYIDYRIYPLKIDWQEVENEESDTYEIFENYSYFGVSLYLGLQNIKTLVIKHDFLKSVIDYYYKNITSNTYEGYIKVYEFISNLPDLEGINKIVMERLVNKKDLLSIKVILDIYEHYYDHFDYPLYNNLLDKYIPVASNFYSFLSDEELKLVEDKLNARKEACDLIKKMKGCVSSNRINLLTHLKKLKQKYYYLIIGITTNAYFLK